MSSIVQDSIALGKGEGPIDERPLTDDERKLVARLLSDPFAFPQTFKTWLVSFLESSDLTLPISSISGLGATLGIGGEGNTGFITGLLPAGTIIGWGSGRIPAGCLRCDGTAYSRTAYSRLFKELGVTWGAGDGVNTFNIPDLRRRVPVGVGSSGFGLTQSDSRAEGERSIDHHHYFGQTSQGGGGHSHGGGTDHRGDHTHEYTLRGIGADNIYSSGDQSRNVVNVGSNVGTSTAGGHSHGLSTDSQGDHSHFVVGDTSGGFDQDHPAYVTIHFIITT